MYKQSDLSTFLRSFLRAHSPNDPVGFLGRAIIRRPGLAGATGLLGAAVGGKSLYNIYRRNNQQIPEPRPLNPLGIKDPLNSQ